MSSSKTDMTSSSRGSTPPPPATDERGNKIFTIGISELKDDRGGPTMNEEDLDPHHVTCGTYYCHQKCWFLCIFLEHPLFIGLFRDPTDPRYWCRLFLSDLISVLSVLVEMIENNGKTSVLGFGVLTLITFIFSWFILWKLFAKALNSQFGSRKWQSCLNWVFRRKEVSGPEDVRRPSERERVARDEFQKELTECQSSSSIFSNDSTSTEKDSESKTAEEGKRASRIENPFDWKENWSEEKKRYALHKLIIKHHQQEIIGKIAIHMIVHFLATMFFVATNGAVLFADYAKSDSTIPWYIAAVNYYGIIVKAAAFNAIFDKTIAYSTNRYVVVLPARILQWTLTVLYAFVLTLTFSLVLAHHDSRSIRGYIFAQIGYAVFGIAVFVPFLLLVRVFMKLFGIKTHTWGGKKISS